MFVLSFSLEMIAPDRTASFRIDPQHQPLARRLGLDGDTIYAHPKIQTWRAIADRQNGFLDFEDEAGRPKRWHVKRYTAVRGTTPAELEIRGIELLKGRGIPTVPLVAWGVAPDRRSFVLIEDLAAHRPCDKLLFGGAAFEPMLAPTADLAARLHVAGLHHRDLYLCHFFARPLAGGGGGVDDLRLIDCARVRELPRLLRRRWVVKDLAQFWYSSLKHEITDDQRHRWLARYAAKSGAGDAEPLKRSILRKVAWITCHDARLNRAQPNRNVSIPTAAPGQPDEPSRRD